MSRTFRSYVTDGAHLSLTAFVGPPSNNRNSVQISLGLPVREHVGLHQKEINAVLNGLKNRVTVRVEGEGGASPLRIRPTKIEGYEMLLALAVSKGYEDLETGTHILLTRVQVEDMIEALEARLDGDDWTSATRSMPFSRVDGDGEVTMMYEPGITMEEFEYSPEVV